MDSDKKRRAVLTTGPSVTQVKRGPEREKTQVDLLKDDQHRLEAAYPGSHATLINEGQPLYAGDTDPIFDED